MLDFPFCHVSFSGFISIYYILYTIYYILYTIYYILYTIYYIYKYTFVVGCSLGKPDLNHPCGLTLGRQAVCLVSTVSSLRASGSWRARWALEHCGLRTSARGIQIRPGIKNRRHFFRMGITTRSFWPKNGFRFFGVFFLFGNVQLRWFGWRFDGDWFWGIWVSFWGAWWVLLLTEICVGPKGPMGTDFLILQSSGRQRFLPEIDPLPIHTLLEQYQFFRVFLKNF